MVVNRIGPLSSAKVVGLLYAILGLAMGAILSFISAVGGLGDRGPGPVGAGSPRSCSSRWSTGSWVFS